MSGLSSVGRQDPDGEPRWAATVDERREVMPVSGRGGEGGGLGGGETEPEELLGAPRQPFVGELVAVEDRWGSAPHGSQGSHAGGHWRIASAVIVRRCPSRLVRICDAEIPGIPSGCSSRKFSPATTRS